MATYPKLQAALFLTVLASGSSFATTITVNTTSVADAVDGMCSLPEAIIAANGNVVHNECPAGTGADRIVFNLPSPSTIVLTSTLPTVTDTLSIRGPEDGELTIHGASSFRHFDFDSPTNTRWFALQDLTLTLGRVNGAAAGGGSINLSNGDTLEATRVSFLENQSENTGGAVRMLNDSIFICDTCTFEGNLALGAAGGGAISQSDRSLLHLVDSTLFGNQTTGTGSGGAISVGRGELIVERTTLSGNTALRNGGAITTTATTGSASITILDSTITANVADVDGDGSGEGGGLWLYATAANSITLTVHNSIIAGNVDGGVADLRPDIAKFDVGDLLLSGSFNLIGTNDGLTTYFPTGDPNADGNFIGTNAAPIDPLLQALAFNGGPTQTHQPIISASTRVIDHGECTGTTRDQRGAGNQATGARIVDQGTITNHVASDGCDIGAFERGGAPVQSTEIFSDGFDLGHTLRWSAEVP